MRGRCCRLAIRCLLLGGFLLGCFLGLALAHFGKAIKQLPANKDRQRQDQSQNEIFIGVLIQRIAPLIFQITKFQFAWISWFFIALAPVIRPARAFVNLVGGKRKVRFQHVEPAIKTALTTYHYVVVA